MIPTQKDYAERRLDLMISTLGLSAVLVQFLPEKLTPKMREGSGIAVLNWHLKTIADAIDNVLYDYTKLQRSLGLPDDRDARYAEVVKMARALKPSTKPEGNDNGQEQE